MAAMFDPRQSPAQGSVPNANAGNSKLVVRAKDEPSVEESAGTLFAAPQAPGQQELGHEKCRMRLRKRDEVSVYEEQLDERYGMDKRAKTCMVLTALLVALFVAAVLLPAGMFAQDKTPTVAGFLENMQANISNLLAYLSGENPYNVMHYKFCRYLVIILAGAALGISGGVYQGAMKNALASPTTLGVISGGTLGAMLYVIFCTDDQAQTIVMRASDIMDYYASLSPWEYLGVVYGQAAFTLVGCFAVVAFVLLVSLLAGKGRISGAVLVITGQVVAVVAASVMTLIRTYYSSAAGDVLKASALQQVRSAQFSALYTELDLLLMGVPILAGIIVILAMRLRLNALTFADDEARSMGISTTATRYVMVGACTLMTAMVVAFCGGIGFVGFVVPHLTRRIVGPNFKYYIPATALTGAVFMVLAYLVASFFALEAFGSVRLLTSILGGIAFVAVALHGRNRTAADEF